MIFQINNNHNKRTNFKNNYTVNSVLYHLSNNFKILLISLLLILTTGYIISAHIPYNKHPSLSYPLSQYNVEEFSMSTHYSNHYNTNNNNNNNNNNNPDSFPKNHQTTTTTNFVKPTDTNTDNSHESISSFNHNNVLIYGPFESQPSTHFELYNFNSLMLVAILFISCFLLLS